MFLPIFSLWGSLLTLVASQNCPDPSDHSVSWVRLKPLGQCKDGESMCPYRITLPPLTVQLPKSFRELEKMTRELQSLTQMVNQLKEDCRECKERRRIDWVFQTDDEEKAGERIQASRFKGTFNTKERQQDIAKQKSTVQVMTSRSAMEDTTIIISNEKNVNPTDFGKQRNITQYRTVNSHATKQSANDNGGQQSLSQKNMINRRTFGEVVNQAESSFPGDLDIEQATQHEKHRDSINVGYQINPSETMTAKGKVKSIPEYYVDTMVTVDNVYDDVDNNDDDDDNNDYDDYDDAKNNQMQIPEGDTILGETGNHFDNKDRKDNVNNGNASREGHDIVTQQSTLKNKGRNNNNSASCINPKPINPPEYPEKDAEVNLRPVNTPGTISEQKKLMSPVTGSAYVTSKPNTDAKMSITVETKINPEETESEQATTRSPGFDITYGIANSQGDTEKQLNDDTDSESGMNLNPVTLSRMKILTLPNINKADVKKDTKIIIPKVQKNNIQTLFKDGTDAGSKGINSKPVDGLKNSRLPISDITDGTVDVSPTFSQMLDSNKWLKVGTGLEHDAGIDSNPEDNTKKVSGLKNPQNSRSPISDRSNATTDVNLYTETKRQNSNSQTSFKSSEDRDYSTEIDSNLISKVQTVIGQDTLRIPISHADDGIANLNSTNTHTDLESDALTILNQVNKTDLDGELTNLKSLTTGIVNVTAKLTIFNTKKQTGSYHTVLKSSRDEEHDIAKKFISGKNNSLVDVSKNQFIASADSESYARIDPDLAGNMETEDGGQKMSKSDFIAVKRPTNLEIPDSENQFKTGTGSNNDTITDLYAANKQKNSPFILDRYNLAADNFMKTHSLSSQTTPLTDGKDAKDNSGIHSHLFSTSETFSQIQAPNIPISVITDEVEVIQTYPETLNGTLNKQLKPGTDAARRAEIDSNPLTKVQTHNQPNMPQLLITGRADVTFKVNKINLSAENNNSKNATEVLTQVNMDETVSQVKKPRGKVPIAGRAHATTDQIKPQAKEQISKNLLQTGVISKKKIYPYQNHTADTVSQQKSTKSRVSAAIFTKSNSNSLLNRNDGPLKRQKPILRKSKHNMTQTRNGQISSSEPVGIDIERKQTLQNNKTTLLRNYAMTNGRYLPTRLVSVRLDKQKEIKNQPEKNKTTGIGLSKDDKKTYLHILPVNESKAFGSRRSKNTSGLINYTRRNKTVHVFSKTVSSPNKKVQITDEISQTVTPTFATHGIVYQATLKGIETGPAFELLNTDNPLIKNTSQTTVITQDKSLKQNLVLDTVNTIGRDSEPPVMNKTEGADSVTAQTSLKTSSVHSNQDEHEKQLKVEEGQMPVGKIPLAVARGENNKLIYPTTTAVTSYTIKNKLPAFNPPTIARPHFMDQDNKEHVKTTLNKHGNHRHENPSQEKEPKKSHNETGIKELQNQGSSQVTDLQLNFQTRTVGSIGTIMDLVTASTGARVSTTSTERPIENKKEKDSTSSAMGKVEVDAKVNSDISFKNNAPVTYNRYSKTSTGSTVSNEDNNGGHSVLTVGANGLTGATLHKIRHGHTNKEDNKKPLIVNNMDERQSLDDQLFANCDGDCDLSHTSWSVLNSPQPSINDKATSFRNCADLITTSTSGIYNVTLNGSHNRTFPVFCDMKTAGGGWTLIQRRFDGSISFNRTWNDYKNGFGNFKGEFWLGNDKIHWLTSSKAMVLRIELEDLDGIKEYAQYDLFHVADESQHYRLTIEGYSGTAGDALQYSKKFNHNHKNFTTPDRDNDLYTSGNCGAYYSSGWWFDACMSANLNGKYYKTRYRGVRNGIFWGTWHNISTESYLTHVRQSFKAVRMMIRPRNM